MREARSWLAPALLWLLVSGTAAGKTWCGDDRCDLPETCGGCPADCGPCAPARLTSAHGDDYSPSWAADGATLAFLSERNGNGAEIMAIDGDGTDERSVARYSGGPPWQFADLSWFGTTGDLIVVDLRNVWEVIRVRFSQGPELPIVRSSEDGATPYMAPLLAVPGGKGARAPTVSADGLRLAWSSLDTPWPTTPCEGRVYQLRVHDGVLDLLTGTSDTQGRVVYQTSPGGFIEDHHAIALSPDGSEIAFVAAPSGWCHGAKRDVFVANLDTGRIRQLTTDGAHGTDHGGVAWSSRNLIAFSAAGELYTVLPDGSDLRRVTATAWNEKDPAWSPDGNRLAYAANPDGHYDIFALDGVGVSGLTHTRVRGSGSRYIVVLRDTVAADARSAEERSDAVRAMASRLLDGRVKRLGHVYANTIRGFSARISRSKARRFAADPDVAYVEEDRRVRITQVDEASCPVQSNLPSWGLDRIDQAVRPLNDRFRYRPTGTGANVYVIDTGIRTTHQEFGGRAQMVFSYDGSADCHGHGTHVAATIAGSTVGVAKSVRVFGLKVLDCKGSGWASDVIAAVDWVTEHHIAPAVANMSLGSDPSFALDDAVRRSIRSGVTYVVAAGNEGTDAATTSPARVAEAITVGASESDDRMAWYSNRGGILDLFAPGSDIVSAWVSSDSARATNSGTSMAAPHVAGVAAVYLLTNPSASPAAVSAAIVANTTRGVLTGVPSGTPNRLLRIFGPCAATCGDRVLNQSWEECDDGNQTNGDGCDGCYLTRLACDVQCCDGSWLGLRALHAQECQGFGAAQLCNGGGGWTNLYFNGAHVAHAPCSSVCGIECCSWSETLRVGGLVPMHGDREKCRTTAAFRCGSGVRNALYYPSGVGGPVDWFVYNACMSRP